MRRLRVQLTVVLALLGMLVLARGAAVFLGAGDAARTSASVQSGVDRVDELRRAATRLGRDLVTMETSRRAYLVTGDEASRRAHLRAEVRADWGVWRVRRLSRPWVDLSPLVERVAGAYRAWARAGRAELAARRQGAGPATVVAAGGGATAGSGRCGPARRPWRTSWPAPSASPSAARTGPTTPPRPWPCAPP